MDIAPPLRTLWRHRRILVLGAILAIVAAAMMMYHLPSLQSRDTRLGVASEDILVDTTTSQIASINAAGSGFGGNPLGGTATILATVMTQGSVVRDITQSAGLDPAQFDAVSLSLSQLSSGGSGSASAPVAPPSDSAVSGPRSGLMTTQALTDANGNGLPIISIQALAWTPEVAARVVNVAVSSISKYVSSTAASQKIPGSRQLRLVQLGPAKASYQASGPSPVEAGGVGIVVFVIVCLGILLASATARGWRRAAALEDADALEFEFEDQGAGPNGAAGTAERGDWAVRPDTQHQDEDAAPPILRRLRPRSASPAANAYGRFAAAPDPTQDRDPHRLPTQDRDPDRLLSSLVTRKWNP